ncbi:phosphatase PAP2 family protein [Cohaesibacter celericrescens]|uniref:Phosphoesterase PA-phosphatase n=1 Tax=Cohaesibacter celericrescens TaxID=2067669 RepID=A0A2N5XPC0_9HYPH|nr:phosphatase PAP2 family protein [Cohaesibacter celericrescens]PLW76352.1 phosphoesterase PA-phosphatase [Cohaesibacter celericrescens]
MLDVLKTDARTRPIYFATLLVLLLSMVFLVVPEIDLWVSGLFFDAQDKFWLKGAWFPLRLRKLGIFAPRLIIILMALFFVARLFWPNLKKLFALSHMLFLMVAAIIGPGLIVNLLLKANWGRARPVQTDLFGGDWPYSQVWVIADNCQKNCSFVSGEGAMSFWMLGLILLLPLGWRKVSFWIIATFALLVSFNRIVFGGHYLSDILLSWALTGWVMVVLWSLFREDPLWGSDSNQLEEAWDKAGIRLRSNLGKIEQKLRKKTANNQTNAQPDDRDEN